MARWSKFEKRMRERCIDGVEFKMSKRETNKFEGWAIVRFIVKYKGKTLINYPQTEDAKKERWLRNYTTATYCAMLFIDGYFALKHVDAFKMTATELFMDAYTKESERRDPFYWYRADHYHNFLETMADDLFMILKICDRRTGKRKLRRMLTDTLNPDFQEMIHDRLSIKKEDFNETRPEDDPKIVGGV